MAATDAPATLSELRLPAAAMIQRLEFGVDASPEEGGSRVLWRQAQDQAGLLPFHDQHRFDSDEKTSDIFEAPYVPSPLRFSIARHVRLVTDATDASKTSKAINQGTAGIPSGHSVPEDTMTLRLGLDGTADPALAVDYTCQPVGEIEWNWQRARGNSNEPHVSHAAFVGGSAFYLGAAQSVIDGVPADAERLTDHSTGQMPVDVLAFQPFPIKQPRMAHFVEMGLFIGSKTKTHTSVYHNLLLQESGDGSR